MLFGKKSLKGTKGVFSSRDVEKYLNDIMDLEKEINLKNIQIARLENQLATTTREMNQLRKQVEKQDVTLQDQRGSVVDLKARIVQLEGRKGAVVKEQATSIDKMQKELANAPTKAEHDDLREARDRLDKQARDLQKAIEGRDIQIRHLTEENLKLKDKLKFLKHETSP